MRGASKHESSTLRNGRHGVKLARKGLGTDDALQEVTEDERGEHDTTPARSRAELQHAEPPEHPAEPLGRRGPTESLKRTKGAIAEGVIASLARQ